MKRNYMWDMRTKAADYYCPFQWQWFYATESVLLKEWNCDIELHWLKRGEFHFAVITSVAWTSCDNTGRETGGLWPVCEKRWGFGLPPVLSVEFHISATAQHSAAVLSRRRVVLTELGSQSAAETKAGWWREMRRVWHSYGTRTEFGCPNSNCLQGAVFSLFLTVAQQVKKFVVFCIRERFISVFTKSHADRYNISWQLTFRSCCFYVWIEELLEWKVATLI
jgi:hypothetical protein